MELLNIMSQKLNEGEQAYAKLFANCSVEDKQHLKEKDLQWKAAELIKNSNDLSLLSRAAGSMRFETRALESAFEELYDIIVTVQED